MSRINSITTGPRALPTAATISQSTTAPPTMLRNDRSSLPRSSSSIPYTPPPTGARPPPAKVSCSRHTLLQRQQPKTKTHKLVSLKGCARYPKVPILGIWNSHIEPASLAKAILARAFWHTLDIMLTYGHCYICTHVTRQV